ncbi:MAG: GspE/PulE family protein, partial [Bacillota bacterium]
MKRTAKKLGELLIDFDYIDESQLNQAINEQENTSKSFTEYLVDAGYVEEEELIHVLQYQLGVPRADIADFDLNSSLSRYIPENIARHYRAVPLEKEEDTLKVAMAEPTDLIAIDDMEMASDLKIEPYIATRDEIKRAQSFIYSSLDQERDDIFDRLSDYRQQEDPELDQLREMVEDAPIVRLTNIIISQALQMRASDIHIEPQAQEVKVRYRIDGVLRENMIVPKYSQAALISRLKIMADLDITRRNIPQDGRVRKNVDGMEVDMRVSTLPTVNGESVVIRLLQKDKSLLDINKLGFSEINLERFQRLISNPHGILLATGPTGSGKSTTLFAVLNLLNTPEKKVITIEDPVEYQLKGVNQVQVNTDTGLTFARTLRSILRQDPDIIMVGEIRDEETATIAARAALTGHLVLSTLHTNDSAGAITRLQDMGIPSYLVASTVRGIVAQRLVRRLCNECKQKYEPGQEQREFLGLEDGDGEQDRPTLYRAVGCEKCNSTGFRGRV